MDSGPDGARRQADALENEGVEVSLTPIGEYSIDFAVYGWFPVLLPSEEADNSEEEADRVQ